MNTKFLNFNILRILSCAGVILLAYACGNNSTKVEKESTDTIETAKSKKSDLNKAKQIFYSLPSPIETAMLIKHAGAKFNPDFLNPITSVSRYTANNSKALNLGVYGADLSFSSMFDQSQYSLKYLSTAKKLADELGILNAIDKAIVTRMEKNINNRDSLMEIISETFMNSNSFLKENGRAEVAATILVGGWVEGFYIATKISKSTTSNKEIVDRIVDQRLSLSTLINLLNEYKKDASIASLLVDLNDINVTFSKVKVTSTNVQPVMNEKTKVTTLKSDSQSKITPEILNELFTKIDAFRTKIVK